MIKINLSKGRGSSGGGGGGAAAAVDLSSAEQMDPADLSSLRKTAMIRLMLIVLGPVALLVLEQQTIPDLEAQLRAANQEMARVSAKNQQAVEAVLQTKKFKKEQATLQAQIATIEALKKDRLREVKILDFVQKDLPEHLWLTRMEMTDVKLVIQGLAKTDAELTQFMESLSRSAYLREVSLVRSSDTNTSDAGMLKRFEVSCLMEKSQ